MEECQEEIQLLFGRTSVEADTTSIKQRADQTDPEEIVRHIENIDPTRDRRSTFYASRQPTISQFESQSRRAMAKGHDTVQSVEYDWRVDHLVIVEFSKVLDLGDATLIELEVVLLQAQSDLFQKIVHDRNDKLLVVAIQGSS